MLNRRITTLILCVLGCVASATIAQPAQPRVNALTPNTVQRGQTSTLMLRGDRLDSATQIDLPSSRGIQSKLIEAKDKTIRIEVTAAANAPLGSRELRVIAANGVANPLPLYVSQYPVVVDAEANNDRLEPQAVELPVTIVGALNTAGDIDVYRFSAKRDQRLIVEVHAAREGSRLDSVVTLFNEAGREVAQNNDHNGYDSFLSYAVPADGFYTLVVRDLKYRGGGPFSYRITAGPIPYIEAIFPIAGRRGSQVDVVPVGYNLGTTQRIKMDLSGGLRQLDVRATSAGAESNALPMEVVADPTVGEVEPNDQADIANPVTLPATINGRIDRAGDSDAYRFSIKRKMKIVAEAYASRYGSPLDPLLTLRDGDGKILVRNDDAAGYDARIERELEPGTYTISVDDLLYGGSPKHVYRISLAELRSPTPDFAVRFQPDTLRITRGGYTKVWCEVVRSNGYKGKVTVGIHGLPSDVIIDPAPVEIGPNDSGVFTVYAAPNAKLGSAPIQLWAVGSVGKLPTLRAAEPQMGNTNVTQGYITVFDSAPFALKPVQLTPWQLAEYENERVQIEQKIKMPTPQLAEAAEKWEQSLADKSRWTAVEVSEFSSAEKTRLTQLPDGSILAGGKAPTNDTYNLLAYTDLSRITAIKLDVLADESLPAGGPGRARNGNFILSAFRVAASSRSQWGSATPVEMHNARADHSQTAFLTPRQSLEYASNVGWAIANKFNQDHWAIFETKEPIANDGGTRLMFTLSHNALPQNIIGRFCISVTADQNVNEGPTLPRNILAILDTPRAERSDEQMTALTRYYMTFADELKVDRARLKTLSMITRASFPPKGKRRTDQILPVSVQRSDGFNGEVTITLEGYTSGRNPRNGQPRAADESLDVQPLKVVDDAMTFFNYRPKANAELGRRLVVLRAEGKVGNETWVQYSPAFPLTVMK